MLSRVRNGPTRARTLISNLARMGELFGPQPLTLLPAGGGGRAKIRPPLRRLFPRRELAPTAADHLPPWARLVRLWRT